MSRRHALELSRSQILHFRRQAGVLDTRLPAGAKSLRRAAWAGLQDSMPRAALLSIHARVRGVKADTWEHASLVQLWGPRYSDYVVAAHDLAIFSLGRLPADARRRARAEDTAARLQAVLAGRRLPFGEAGHAMGVPHNNLRYAAATGTVLLRWDGARQPVIWTVPPPLMDASAARLELARRHLHIFGPASPASFTRWAGIGSREAGLAFDALTPELTRVRTPLGHDAWILADDEAAFRSKPTTAPARARLLPSGDAYYLLWGADRELLVPQPKRRVELWTSRVWPGALLLDGEVAGIWRRTAGEVFVEPWQTLSPQEWEAVEAEVLSLPLRGPMRLNYPAASGGSRG